MRANLIIFCIMKEKFNRQIYRQRYIRKNISDDGNIYVSVFLFIPFFVYDLKHKRVSQNTLKRKIFKTNLIEIVL